MLITQGSRCCNGRRDMNTRDSETPKQPGGATDAGHPPVRPVWCPEAVDHADDNLK